MQTTLVYIMLPGLGGLSNDDRNAKADQVVHCPTLLNKIKKPNYNTAQNPGNIIYILLCVVPIRGLLFVWNSHLSVSKLPISRICHPKNSNVTQDTR